MRNISKASMASVTIGLAIVGLTAAARSSGQGGGGTPPWMAGHCYRATVLDPTQQHTVRVLEDPVGAWARVQSDPRSPRVPGVPASGRMWLNTLSVFSVEEVECASFPHER